MPTAALDGGRAGAGPRRVRFPTTGASKLAAARAAVPGPRRLAAIAGLFALLVVAAALATDDRAERLAAIATDAADDLARAAAQARPFLQGDVGDLGWRVSDIRLTGATAAARGEIMAAADVRPGQSLGALDLGAVRARVETVGWVESARVIRLLPSTLEIAVVQRPLMAIWRHDGRWVVVTANGAVDRNADPIRFPALPLVVGEGANTAAVGFVPLLARHPALAARVAALVRVDGRRWDLDMKDGGRVLLPAADPDGALGRLDDLDGRARILHLGLERIDLRDPEMIVVRPRAAAGAQAPASEPKQGGVDGTD